MITNSFGWFSGCDLAMPHDMRYDSSDIRHHPQNCPARPVIRIAELEEMLTAATDTAIQRGKHIDHLQTKLTRVRTTAAQLAVGWDFNDADPVYVAYGQAFRESAGRIFTTLDGADGG